METLLEKEKKSYQEKRDQFLTKLREQVAENEKQYERQLKEFEKEYMERRLELY